MAKPLFANNAAVFLTAAVAPADLTIALPADSGSRFPNPTDGDWFMLTLENLAENLREIVRVTGRAGDTLVVQRAQEGTMALAFPASGTLAAHRLTAGELGRLRDGGGGGGGVALPIEIGDVTGLPEALGSKAPTEHRHAIGDVDGLPEALASKAPATHQHGLDDLAPPGAANAGKAVRAKLDGIGHEYVDRPFEGSVSVRGKPAAAEVLIYHPMSGPVRFAVGLAGWRYAGTVAAAANAVFLAKKNGVGFGTLTIAAGSTAGAFAAATATDFVAGDVFTLEAPAAQDAALADFGITVYGVRR